MGQSLALRGQVFWAGAARSASHWGIGESCAMRRLSATEVLEAMVAMFASGDPSAAAAVIAEDYLDHQGLGAGPMRGVDGFAHVVRTNYAAYAHQQVSIEDLFGVSDRAVARISWRGRRHDGEGVNRETIDIVRVAEGRAVEHWGARASDTRHLPGWGRQPGG